MKTARKVLIIALCAVLLVSISVMGTMAYLTSQDSVKNTFTVGNVKITLDELDVDNDSNTEDNVQYGEGENATIRDRANAYKLMPGHTYTKDPIVHVDDKSEDCYLFVVVSNQIADIEAAPTVATQMDTKGWKAVDAAKGIYVYGNPAAPTAVTAGSNVSVFDNFGIKGDVTNTQLAGYDNNTITVTPYAIQAAGFEGKTASEIWTAANFAA